MSTDAATRNEEILSEHQKQSSQFYTQTIDSVKKQRNIAISLSIFCCFILTCWIVFALRMAPVNDPFPILFEVDKSTGNVNVSTSLKSGFNVTPTELQEKADAVSFIRAWWTFDNVDWNFRQEYVSLRSNQKVADKFEKHIKLQIKENKRNEEREVTITNVIHLNSQTIQARFYTQPPSNERESRRKYYVANIKFRHVQQVASLRSLFLNPNGFIVEEVRYDREFVDKISR